MDINTLGIIDDLKEIEKTIENKVESTNLIDIKSSLKELRNNLDENGIENKLEIKSNLIKLNEMLNDYEKVRGILLENVEQSREVAQIIQANIFSGEETADYIASYATLINVINTSVKMLTASYKDITNTLLNIKKLESTTENVTNNTTNTINIISTVDVIEGLRNKANLLK